MAGKLGVQQPGFVENEITVQFRVPVAAPWAVRRWNILMFEMVG